ncbi:MAG TPA: hypothetical protein VI457_06015 [Methylococcaceae bacterium]|nr:hypothetical protein [Methylococcaceae bacterium]
MKQSISILLAGIALAGCATGKPPREEVSPTLAQQPPSNDYPTLARVEFVMQCMNKKGAQNYDTLYSCVCSADKLAEKMPYQTYAEAQAFTSLSGLAGERGGAFRDHPESKPLRKGLQEALAYAEDSCSFGKQKTDGTKAAK